MNDFQSVMWLALIVLFVVVEAATVGLVSSWFAAGAVVALLASFFGAETWLQITLFFVVSGVLLVFTRPLAKAYLDTRKQRTNADRNIGEIGIVTERIDNLKGEGEVHIGGKHWTARAVGQNSIEKDARVVADRIEGVKLFVSPLPPESVEEETAATEDTAGVGEG